MYIFISICVLDAKWARWWHVHGGSDEMNIVERVYDDESKQKGAWRTVVNHPFLHTAGNSVKWNWIVCAMYAFSEKKTFVCEAFTRILLLHTHKHRLAPNRSWNGLKKTPPPPPPGSFVIDLLHNFTIQNYLHRFIWLLLISLLASAVQWSNVMRIHTIATKAVLFVNWKSLSKPKRLDGLVYCFWGPFHALEFIKCHQHHTKTLQH